MAATRDPAKTERIPILVGRFVATIEAPSFVATQVRSVFVDLLRSADGLPGSIISVRAEGTASDRGTPYQVTVDGVRWVPEAHHEVIDQLVYVIMRATLDAEPELLHLHAGYVAVGGKGVLIAGFPGSGKSTLVTALIEAGFDYFTDERVGLDRAGRLFPLPKPISLVESSFSVLAHLDPARTGVGVVTNRLWHVPASAVREGSVTESASLHAVVFVQFDKNAPLMVTEVHPIEAARRLLSDSPDALRFGPDGVALVAGVCNDHHAVQVVFGETDAAIRAIRALADRAPRVREDQLSHLSGGISEDVVGVAVGAKCLVRRNSNGELIELDGAAAAWLQLLDGHSPLGDIISEVAEANGVTPAQVAVVAQAAVQELTNLGVV